ncbi:exodeoxyribonuclease V subunit beta [Peptoniphilus sp. HMSC062D09]|uniref:UvrD-helicase domain-containing protein n=1 Tax=Peptoniphilus sp. HMSC062D09 TaxID=1739305 RepID=UPI0008A395E8|nr:UvrD-helicase domain-containing protein [Peptoniphilus sp. HMSC062D09]OFK79063.1 DNA helicase UvrD [Peptoniphilus sp. HMSC062D09]
MKLNKVQLEAVTSIDKDVTLMAGAGTGKTRVLTSRFINIVKNNHDPKKILAITFTKKAAEEMLGRISKELVEENIDFEEKDLNIMTIHSFALEIVRNYSYLIGINPNFTILDDGKAGEMLENAVKASLNNIRDEKFKRYLIDFKTNPFEERKLFADLYGDFRNKNLDFSDILSMSLNFNKTSKSSDELFLLLDDFRKVSGNKFKKFYDDNIYEIKNTENLDLEILNSIEENLGSSSKYEDKIKKIVDLIHELKKNLEIKNKEYYEIIIEILKEIDKNYSREKRDIKALDYDDIISYTHLILGDERFKKNLKDRYSYILVDEYQDTNEIQNEIINTFVDSNLFIVGDPKQSIYAFRGTDLKSYYSFSDKIKKRGISLVMNKNYRSDGKIINFINSTFENLIESYEEMDFDYENGGDVYQYDTEDNNEIADLVLDLLKKFEEKEIAILSRSNAQIDEISRILSLRNISFNKGERSLEEIEVLKVTKNILSTIYSPEDFLNTLALFNSPLLNFNFKDLVKILNLGIDNVSALLDLKCDDANINNFIKFLNKLKEKSKVLLFDEMIEEIMNYFYDLKTLKKIDWEYLYKFKEMAREYLEDKQEDYRSFEKYLLTLSFEDLEEGINLLTIHKSKGLEFDAVIISHMDRGKKLGQVRKIIVNRELGLAIKSDFSDYRYRAINEKLRDVDREEEKRVLYVAMTRAKRELILFGNLKKYKSDSYFDLLDRDIKIKEYEFSKDIKENIPKKKYPYLDLDLNFENRIREYYTVTDFLNFKRSPIDFYKKYFLGIDDYTLGQGKIQVMDPKTLGSIVHLFAQIHSKKDTNKDNIDEYLKDIFEYYEEEIDEDKLNIARELSLNYLDMEEENIIDKELLFYYDLEGFLVKGFIDQVIKIDGEYSIVDLKTSDMDLDYIKSSYENQLVLYSAIYEKLYKVKVKAAYIFDLRGKNKIDIEINEEKSKLVMEEFLNYIKFIRSHTNYKDYLKF